MSRESVLPPRPLHTTANDDVNTNALLSALSVLVIALHARARWAVYRTASGTAHAWQATAGRHRPAKAQEHQGRGVTGDDDTRAAVAAQRAREHLREPRVGVRDVGAGVAEGGDAALERQQSLAMHTPGQCCGRDWKSAALAAEKNKTTVCRAKG